MSRVQRARKYARLAAVSLLVISMIQVAAGTSGCNIFSKLDPPGDAQDKYAAAVALANAGQCQSAVDQLTAISPPNDDVLSALGWAYLCVGGATAVNIATSLYKFSSNNSNDFTVVGALARSMVPMTTDKLNAVQNAILSFNGVNDAKRQGLELGIAEFAAAASLLAKQAGNDGGTTVDFTDVAQATCSALANNCAVGCARGPTGMTDNDVAAFTADIANAATALSITGAADLQTLATNISGQIGLTAPVQRCFIFNKTIPQ
jgi:hypothetical protein